MSTSKACRLFGPLIRMTATAVAIPFSPPPPLDNANMVSDTVVDNMVVDFIVDFVDVVNDVVAVVLIWGVDGMKEEEVNAKDVL